MTHSFPTRRSSDLRPNQRQARHGPRDDMPTKRLADNLAAVFRRADSMGGQSRTVPPFIKGCAQCAAVYIFASCAGGHAAGVFASHRSEEHTSELQSLMRISYAVFCLKKKKT